MNPIETTTGTASEAAKRRLLSRRGEPLFIADWERVLMIHFEVDAEALQRDVPFQLDLRDGCAFASVVAFTMHGMRPRIGGRLAAWLFRPIATHDFLNGLPATTKLAVVQERLLARCEFFPWLARSVDGPAAWLLNREAIRR